LTQYLKNKGLWNKKKIRVISARDMSKKERRGYEEGI